MTTNDRRIRPGVWSLVLTGAVALLVGATPVTTFATPPCEHAAKAQRQASVAKRHTTHATRATRREPVVDEWVIVRQVQPTVVERRTTIETVPRPVVQRTVETIEEE